MSDNTDALRYTYTIEVTGKDIRELRPLMDRHGIASLPEVFKFAAYQLLELSKQPVQAPLARKPVAVEKIV